MAASSEKRWEKEMVLTKGMALTKRPLNGSLFVFVRQSGSALANSQFAPVAGFTIAAITLLCPFRGTRLVFALEGCIATFASYCHNENYVAGTL
jgi:hypothetical protein